MFITSMADNLLSSLTQDHCPGIHSDPLCAFSRKVELAFMEMAIAMESLGFKPSALVPFHSKLNVPSNHIQIHHLCMPFFSWLGPTFVICNILWIQHWFHLLLVLLWLWKFRFGLMTFGLMDWQTDVHVTATNSESWDLGHEWWCKHNGVWHYAYITRYFNWMCLLACCRHKEFWLDNSSCSWHHKEFWLDISSLLIASQGVLVGSIQIKTRTIQKRTLRPWFLAGWIKTYWPINLGFK